MKKLIVEAHRRSLWQVLGIYLAASWGALEVVDLLAANVGLPAWFPSLALGLLVIGLPIVLATAFVQEGREAAPPATTAEGGAPAVPTGISGLFTWRNAILGGVAAFALWGVVAAGWLLVGGNAASALVGPSDSEPRLRSIAVLPFATRSTQPADAFFAEGMHDDLLTRLARIDSLTVISRTSVMQYAETMKSIPTIGGELGVAVVLEGGIQRAGDHVRVNVQLIDAATDRHLWAETYDEELTAANVFDIQSSLARRIAASLRATLSPQVTDRLDEHPTESLEAYDAYVRGRSLYMSRGAGGEGLDQVRALYDEALAADSGFAAAWAGVATVEMARLNWGQAPPGLSLARARAALERASALDPDGIDVLLAQGLLLLLDGRVDEGVEVARRATELNPGNATAFAAYGRALQAAGRFEEAVAASRRAVELDPLSPAPRNSLADRLYFSGDYESSIVESERVVAMAPDDWYAYYNLGWSLAAAGRPMEGVSAFRSALERTEENPGSVRMGMAYAFARAAQRDSALAYLAGVDPTTSYDYALVLFELGDAERAFEALEGTLTANPDQLARMEGDPTTRALRADSRFGELIRRLGL